jgi:hypothetical protein
MTFICDSCASEFDRVEGFESCKICGLEMCSACKRPFSLCHDCFENRNLGIKLEVEKAVIDTMKKIFPMFDEKESGSFDRISRDIDIMVNNYISIAKSRAEQAKKKGVDKSFTF